MTNISALKDLIIMAVEGKVIHYDELHEKRGKK